MIPSHGWFAGNLQPDDTPPEPPPAQETPPAIIQPNRKNNDTWVILLEKDFPEEVLVESVKYGEVRRYKLRTIDAIPSLPDDDWCNDVDQFIGELLFRTKSLEERIERIEECVKDTRKRMGKLYCKETLTPAEISVLRKMVQNLK
jgi:hypothetical protein